MSQALTCEAVQNYLSVRGIHVLQWLVARDSNTIVLAWVCCVQTDLLCGVFCVRFEPGHIQWDTKSQHGAPFEHCLVRSGGCEESQLSKHESCMIGFDPTDEKAHQHVPDRRSMPHELQDRSGFFGTVVFLQSKWYFWKRHRPVTVWHATDFVSTKPRMHYSIDFEMLDECRESWSTVVSLYQRQWQDTLQVYLSAHLAQWRRPSDSCLVHTPAHAELTAWQEAHQIWDVFHQRICHILSQLHTISKALQIEWDGLDDTTQCSTAISQTLAYADRKKEIYKKFDQTKLVSKRALQALGQLHIHTSYFWFKSWAWCSLAHHHRQSWEQQCRDTETLLHFSTTKHT